MSAGGIEALKGAFFFLLKIDDGTNDCTLRDSNELTISVGRGICSFN